MNQRFEESDWMSRNKSKELKDFLIFARKKISPQLSEAPIWVVQRSGSRKYNLHQHRNWRETHLALGFHNRVKKRKKHKKGV